MDDPFELLGVAPDAPPDDVAAAYRAAAKRFHPDIAGDDATAAARMAEINAAYDAIRNGDAAAGHEAAAAAAAGDRPAGTGNQALGAWLPERTRRALGRELLVALAENEPVRLVTDASTWASPSARLVATDRRLLWLHDDAVTHRVRSLRFRDIAGVEQRLQWPRRRRAALRVRTTSGRRLAFADLAPEVAAQLERLTTGGSAAARSGG